MARVERETHIFDLNDEAIVLDKYLILAGTESYHEGFLYLPNRRFPIDKHTIPERYSHLITNKRSLPLYGMILIRELFILANIYVNGLSYVKYELEYNGFKLDTCDIPYYDIYNTYSTELTIPRILHTNQDAYFKTVTDYKLIDHKHPLVAKFLLNNFGMIYSKDGDVTTLVVELFRSSIRLLSTPQYMGRGVRIDIDTYVLAIAYKAPIESDILSKLYNKEEVDYLDNSFYTTGQSTLFDDDATDIHEELYAVYKPDSLSDVVNTIEAKKESFSKDVDECVKIVTEKVKPIVTYTREYRGEIDEADRRSIPTLQD